MVLQTRSLLDFDILRKLHAVEKRFGTCKFGVKISTMLELESGNYIMHGLFKHSWKFIPTQCTSLANLTKFG